METPPFSSKYETLGMTWLVAYWFDVRLSSAVPLLYEVKWSGREYVIVPPDFPATVVSAPPAVVLAPPALLAAPPLVVAGAAVVVLDPLLSPPHAAATSEAPSSTIAALAVLLKLMTSWV